MKAKALIPLRSKLFNPCRKLFRIFSFKLKRPLFVRPLKFRHRHANLRKSPKKSAKSALLSLFRSLRLRRSRKMDKLTELSEAELQLTPAVAAAYNMSKRGSSYEDVEDACRSFENYLVEMIVEEGKVSDLMDVEELLYCWKNLTCPVFIDLVSRFYGELCTDLFSANDDDSNTPN